MQAANMFRAWQLAQAKSLKRRAIIGAVILAVLSIAALGVAGRMDAQAAQDQSQALVLPAGILIQEN